MKKQFLNHLFTFTLAIFMLVGCNNAPKQAKETKSTAVNTAVEANSEDKLKEQIIEIIQSSPKGVELVDMLNKAGSSYMIDLTVPVEKAEKLMNTTSKSLGFGMYGFDTKYASVYNRSDVATKINDVEMKLMVDLGISVDLDVAKNYLERVANNKSNKDSLKILTENAIAEFHKHMAMSSHSNVYALTFIGSNVEGLYILTQMSLYAKDNSKFLEIMSNQKERVKSVARLLDKMATDETLKPYIESMKPIIKFFEENNTIGNSEIKTIAPQIEKLRNSMI